jgi:formylglycine-generating enzyme required for sulfatase activity
MVLVTGGVSSGTNPLGEGEYYAGDYPETYALTVDSFYMDATEVTKARWDTIYTWAVANGYEFENVGSGKAATHPVHTVTWFDCVKWCNARSEMEGRTPCYTLDGATYKTGEPALFFDPAPVCDMDVDGYRLPTSDEWEYAARGGLDSRRFPWGDTITHSQANYYSHTEGDPLSSSYDISPTHGFHPDYDDDDEALMPYTSPVGAFAANAYGLYDMEGNVWEWCTTESTLVRIRRGGSWYGFARCGLELEEDPYGVSDAGGFRSVRR